MKKLVRESLYEKFTEDFNDPISDMGIGGYAFNTLKPGAVITAIVPGLAINQNNNGGFTSVNAGIEIPIDYPVIVIGVRNYIIPGHKELTLFKSSDTNKHKIGELRQQLKDGQRLSASNFGANIRLIVNEKKFNNKFKVIERGF